MFNIYIYIEDNISFLVVLFIIIIILFLYFNSEK